MIRPKHFVRSALAAVMLLTVGAVASAQTLPGTGWYTTATFQNVGGTTGTVSLQVLPQEGASGSASTASFSLDAGANKVFLPGGASANGTVDVSPALTSNFAGSMVVSSDQPVVAIGQVGNNPLAGLGITGGNASAMYNGSDAVATTLIGPLVKNKFGNKTTYFSIQAGGSNVSYTATIKDAAGGTHTKTGTITAGRSVLLDPGAGFDPPMASSNCGEVNTSPCVGALTVVATGGNIVGAVVETQTNVSPQQIAQSASLFASSDATDTIYCAVVKNAHGPNKRYGGLTVANVGGSETTVKLTLTLAGGTGTVGSQYTSSVVVPAGASRTFIGTNNNIGGLPAGAFASAVLTTEPTGGSILALVNESNFLGPGALKATTTRCSPPSMATAKVGLPLVKQALGNVAYTGVTFQNVGSTDTTVSAAYNCGTKGNFTLTSRLLKPGEADTFFKSATIPTGSNCAVTATATNPTDKIIGIANESSDEFKLPLDTKSYEGFNLQ